MNLALTGSESEPEVKCKWPETGKPSIVIRGGAGRLGNILFSYLIGVGMKVSNCFIICVFEIYF